MNRLFFFILLSFELCRKALQLAQLKLPIDIAHEGENCHQHLAESEQSAGGNALFALFKAL